MKKQSVLVKTKNNEEVYSSRNKQEAQVGSEDPVSSETVFRDCF